MMVFNSTNRIMMLVLVAVLPGALISTYFFGLGILINVATCALSAIFFESIALALQRKKLTALTDGTAVIAGVLLGLALPSDINLMLPVIGTGFAILFGKHVYGGLGHNLFNPAMVGYAVMIVSFPLAMSNWPVLFDSTVDGVTGATPLDIMKFRGATTIDEIWTTANGFSSLSSTPWQWINIGYLAGGVILIYYKCCNWQAPLAMLLALIVASSVFYDSGSSESLGSPMFHLFSGGTMLVAFFVVTDPVTSPNSSVGLYIFGAGVGLITFIIRSYGAYPDGFAFAILLMNSLAPIIDHVRLRWLK
jgi:electron transport complex protein RnfD